MVSGYLFFRKWSEAPRSKTPGYKDVSNLLFRLAIPTIIFSTILYLPKVLFHSNEASLTTYFYDVFGGVSYWFTSAMVISQAVLLVSIRIGMRKVWQFIILSIGIILLMPVLKLHCPSAFPWYWKTGLASVVLMTLGGILFQYRLKIKSCSTVILWSAIIAYIAAVIYSWKTESVINGLMSVNFNIQGIIIGVIGISFIFAVCYNWNPQYRILQFIGRNSIVFYFLSGAIPAVLSVLPFWRILTPVVSTLLVSSIAVTLSVCATWLISRYLPFLTDLRRICTKQQRS